MLRRLLACAPLLLLPALAGCTNREPLYSRASLDSDSLPAVLCYDPSPAISPAPPETCISLFFSVPMKPDTVLEALEVVEDGASLDVYSGTVEWQAGHRLLLYRPSAGFADGGTVSVSISTAAESESGLHLVAPVSWSFDVLFESNPGGDPAPTGTSPAPGEVVLLDRQVTLSFDRKVLQSTVEASFMLRSTEYQDIRTAKDGEFTWQYDSGTGGVQAVYTPRDDLQYGRTYEVALNNNGALCRDLWNNEYAGAFTQTFHTIHKAIYVSGNNGDAGREGYHPLEAVNEIALGMEKAREHGFSLVRIEGQGAAPDYIESVYVPSGLTLEGGWDESFTNHDPGLYPTDIAAPAGDQYAVIVKHASGVVLRHLSCAGGSVGGAENGALLVDGSSSVTVRSCSFAGSTANTASHAYGMAIMNSSDITIRESRAVGGNSGTDNTGILVDSGSYNVSIQRNSSIVGGYDGTCYGIQVRGTTGPITIQDNTMINGGNTAGNAYGVYIDSATAVNIYRNSIIGGESTLTDLINTGIHVASSGECLVYNNFITGGGGGTNSGSLCFGVRILDTDTVIINNTINGGGTATGGISDSYALCVQNESWMISPLIVNNIIMGGYNARNYGIRLQSNSSLLECGIFNNAFSEEYCTHYLTVGAKDFLTTDEVDTCSQVTPSPEYSSEFTPLQIQFMDRPAYDYRIHTEAAFSPDPTPIRDKGSSYHSPSFLVTELNEASGVTADLLTDIDGTVRDRYTIDRGAHEAYE